MQGDALAGVAAAVGLHEGRHGVEEVLRHLSGLERAGNRALSRLTGLPVPLVAAVCAELRLAGLLTPGRPASLSPAGRELVERLGRSEAARCACPACGGTGMALPAPLQAVRAELAALLRGAPPADARLNQAHCTIDSKLRRFAYLLDQGALSGRAVLLLGDDDFLGLALPLAARALGSRPPRRLAVLDVDPAVIEFSRAAMERRGIEAELLVHDLRQPLPAGLVGAFDTVFTDPPYTLGGAELFLSRAAAALRRGPGGQVLLCFGPKPPHETAALQRVITGIGFAVHRLVRNFNEYLGASVLAGTSHLYHLAGGDALAPSVVGEFEGALYTGDVHRLRRGYACRACGARLVVGPGERWATIQDLRLQRCPRCRGAVFSPGPRAGRRRTRPGRDGSNGGGR
jgi:predicted methyltransferase/DNA-directed RNA polymerase subunit RPC12/RpoP